MEFRITHVSDNGMAITVHYNTEDQALKAYERALEKPTVYMGIFKLGISDGVRTYTLIKDTR